MTPYQAQEEDIPHILMIRERVDIRGRVRAMEPAEDMAALRVKPSSVGIIKQAPAHLFSAHILRFAYNSSSSNQRKQPTTPVMTPFTFL